MHKRKLLVFFIFLIFLINNACIKQSKGLTLQALKNSECNILTYDRRVKLTDGEFESGKIGDEDYINTWIDDAAFGDLTGDGEIDAAIILISTGGGTGRFYELAVVLNKDGEPHHVTSVELGDREIVESLKIQNRVIILDMTTHGPDDAMCCPTVKKVIKYRFSNNKLIEQ